MEITGTQRVRSPRQAVWDALNDPVVLAKCIPGCTSLVETEPDQFNAEMTLKVGPVSAHFRGSVSLEDKQELEGCRIVGSGSGGAAGFAKGEAKVALSETEGATDVVYDIDIETGGKIASLGARMMRRVIESNIETFFESLANELDGGVSKSQSRITAPMMARQTDDSGANQMLNLLDRLAWFGAGVGATLALLIFVELI